jgi:hypothetical protein
MRKWHLAVLTAVFLAAAAITARRRANGRHASQGHA